MLINQSPAHAKEQRGKAPTKEMDRGTGIHKLVLGKGREFAAVEAKDWRTNAAKEARDEARAKGLIPVLADDLEEWGVAAATFLDELAARGFSLTGQSEVAVAWTEPTAFGPVRCRGMLDHVWIAEGRIFDLKVTENAAPPSVERTAEQLGYAIQAAAYSRALVALRPELAGRVSFHFAFMEPAAPHAVNIAKPDGAFRELGERRWARAVDTWAACSKAGRWPGYGPEITTLSPPPWAMAREEFSR